MAIANVDGMQSTLQLKYSGSGSKLNSSGSIALPANIAGIGTDQGFYCSGPTQSGVAAAGAIVALDPQNDCSSQVNRCQLVASGVSPGNFNCNYIGIRTDADAQSLAIKILNNSDPDPTAVLGYPLPAGDSLELQYAAGGSGQIQKIIELGLNGISKIWSVYTDPLTQTQKAQLQEWNLNGVWLKRATNNPSASGYMQNLVKTYGMDATALTSIQNQNKAVFVELEKGSNKSANKLDGNVWSAPNEWGIDDQATQRVFAQQPVMFWNANLRKPLMNQVVYDLGPYSRQTAYGGGLNLIQSPTNTVGQPDKTAFRVQRQGNQFYVDIQDGQKFYVKDPGAILQASHYPGGIVPHTPGFFTRTKGAYDGNLTFVSNKGGVWIVDASGTPHSQEVNFTYQQQGGATFQGSDSTVGRFDHVDPRTGSGVYRVVIARPDSAILKLCVDESGDIDSGGAGQRGGNRGSASSRISNFQNDPTQEGSPDSTLTQILKIQVQGVVGREAISLIPSVALRGAAMTTFNAFGYVSLISAFQGTLSGPNELAFEAQNTMSCPR